VVGIDLIEVDRIEQALARRPALAQRLFTPGELAYAARHVRPATPLAARFAAKEAVAKALALEAWSPREVEVVSARPEGGPPAVRLHGAVAERAAGRRIDISLTHTRGMAAAMAVVGR
jgi:holo-[acyl-carrier protein] synthase